LKTPRDGSTYFFVDESGDPAFYGKGGSIIVGSEGCSRVFLVGIIECQDPPLIADALATVREQVRADPYLRPVPSVQKSVTGFHAKDDCPEVRMLVFKTLATLPFTAQVVVARKIEPMFRTRFQGSQDRFYDNLIGRLFENRLHRFSNNVIRFARRGKKARQHALRAAIEEGAKRFRTKWKTEIQTSVTIESTQPIQEPLLQVVDYTNWAVYRAFERGEMRYFDALRNHYELIVDVFDRDRYAGSKN
jgi:hypothetical protein